MDMSEKLEWCPTRRGTFTAYGAEWSSDGIKWKKVLTHTGINPNGTPYPLGDAGICMAIGLLGFAQANAIAWSFSAQAASQGEDIQVRVQSYEILYDIKARKYDDNQLVEGE